MKWKWVVTVAAFGAAALVIVAFVVRKDEASSEYRLVDVTRGTIESVVTSTGSLQATETIEVGTQVSGQIAELLVDFNDRVAKGQLLARIDATILQQEVRSAEASLLRSTAELEQAQRALERSRTLHEQRVITDTEYEQAEYAATVAKAAQASAQIALDRARRNLSYTEIRAPIAGVVVERSVDVGQTVAASMSAPTLFLIARDLAQMEILASVDESDIGKIHEGMEARFTVQAYGEESFTGEVQQVRLQSKTQDNVVTYGVVVRVPNVDGRLLPGMTATVAFVVARAEDVLRVANAALRVQPTEAMRAALARGVPSDSAGSRAGAGVQRGSASGQNGAGESGSRVVGAQRGMLWVLGADGVPAVVRVRTGLTDGQYTEISGPEVQEGMQVIAGVTGASAGAAQSASPNPFQGAQGNRGGPPRGF